VEILIVKPVVCKANARF